MIKPKQAIAHTCVAKLPLLQTLPYNMFHANTKNFEWAKHWLATSLEKPS
jgi:hypothetical protein